MREIKFRAWCEHKKVICYPDSFYCVLGEVQQADTKLTFKKNHIGNTITESENVQNGQQTDIGDTHYCGSKKIMQYTGLKDKNGKKIYEGDIVKVPNDWEGYGWMAGEIREVYFCDGAFRLKPKHNPQINRGDRGCHIEDDMDKCEIIGNIYENPELLK